MISPLYISNVLGSCNCSPFTKAISMRQTDDTTEPGSFPIEVFDVDKVSIGVAINKDEYISIWNALAKHSAIGYLTGAAGPFVFQYHKNLGPVPNYVYGNPVNASTNNYPVITLIGSNPYTMYVGDTYVEPGFSATDSEDGNITGNVITSTSIDNSQVGSGQKTYNVTDAGGLAATQRVRVVNVIAIPCVSFTAVQTAPGEITITFIRSAIATAGYNITVFDESNNVISPQVTPDLTGIAIGGTVTQVLDSTNFTFAPGATYRFLVSQARTSGSSSSGTCGKQSVTMSSASTIAVRLGWAATEPSDFTTAAFQTTVNIAPGANATIPLSGMPDEQVWYVDYPNTEADFATYSIGLTTDQAIPDINLKRGTAASKKLIIARGPLSVDTSQNLILKH